MSFLEIVTLILIIAKLFNVIDWSWFWVLFPYVSYIIVSFVLALILTILIDRKK